MSLKYTVKKARNIKPNFDICREPILFSFIANRSNFIFKLLKIKPQVLHEQNVDPKIKSIK